MITYNGRREVTEKARFDYAPLRDRLIESFSQSGGRTRPGVLSDKMAADMCRTSERQIRNARLGDKDGLKGLNSYLADHCAIVGLGLHPRDIWGDDWVTAESLYAGDIQEGKEVKIPRKVKSDPINAGRTLPDNWGKLEEWKDHYKKEIRDIEKARERRAREKEQD